MMAYADLELGLHRWNADSYAVELRFSQPESDADVQLVQTGVPLDLETLRRLARDGDVTGHGRLLGESLFADEEIREAFGNARALDVPLRLRLFVGPSAPELHGLLWETLPDPDHPGDGASLLTNERVLFSRYLSSQDWRRVRLRPKGDLRALVAIANPTNVADYQPDGRHLAPIDVPCELERARVGLRDIPLTALASGGSATVNNLVDHLRDGYDVLYLVCHGAVIRGEPWLWLEDETGGVARVAGRGLVTRLRELEQQPRLVVLVSCQSAGDTAGRGDDGGVLAALGPRLAEVGIPAVLAMQGNVTMQTMAAFMPAFFAELQRTGQIDHAMAVARGAVRERPDAWMPVLFMRLKSGRIWYVPGFAPDQVGGPKFPKWPALLSAIRQGRCTPILGPGLTESLLGSRREIAQRWAETYHFPMAPQDREDLPQVAQYLAVNQAQMFPRDELVEHLRQELLRRCGRDPSDRLSHASLDELVATVGAERRDRLRTEPHRVLAELPFPIYVTTNPDNLLTEALRAAGKEPQEELFAWNKEIDWPPSIYDDRTNAYQPSPERPLVYHLFGTFRYPETLVLTEDDYFDYLIGVTQNQDLIPPAVLKAMAANALLFIGFQMDDWNFRVLFRGIANQEGGAAKSRYSHVGVQLNPEEGRILEVDGARTYLETYFKDDKISIFWGSAEDFVEELQQQVLQGG